MADDPERPVAGEVAVTIGSDADAASNAVAGCRNTGNLGHDGDHRPDPVPRPSRG
jgi:hypothetical protein